MKFFLKKLLVGLIRPSTLRVYFGIGIGAFTCGLVDESVVLRIVGIFLMVAGTTGWKDE